MPNPVFYYATIINLYTLQSSIPHHIPYLFNYFPSLITNLPASTYCSQIEHLSHLWFTSPSYSGGAREFIKDSNQWSFFRIIWILSEGFTVKVKYFEVIYLPNFGSVRLLPNFHIDINKGIIWIKGVGVHLRGFNKPIRYAIIGVPFNSKYLPANISKQLCFTRFKLSFRSLLSQSSVSPAISSLFDCTNYQSPYLPGVYLFEDRYHALIGLFPSYQSAPLFFRINFPLPTLPLITHPSYPLLSSPPNSPYPSSSSSSSSSPSLLSMIPRSARASPFIEISSAISESLLFRNSDSSSSSEHYSDHDMMMMPANHHHHQEDYPGLWDGILGNEEAEVVE